MMSFRSSAQSSPFLRLPAFWPGRRIACLAAVVALIGVAPVVQGQSIGRPVDGQGAMLAEQGAVEVQELLSGLDMPWALAFLPDGEHALITERTGALRLWRKGADTVSEPLSGTPEVFTRGQGGLLDVALSPSFAQDRRVYLSFARASADDAGRAGTAVGYGRLSDDMRSLESFKVIFQQTPQASSGHHFGSRLVFDRDGMLFIALGEHNQRATAQDLGSLQGKLVRVDAEGRAVQDNPFVGRQDAQSDIWSYGHRNQQGAALNPWTGAVWTHEHGPRGGDEINIPQAGRNYGWPIATYGRNYTGFAIPEAKGSTVPGMEPPLYYWERSPAISGMAFYDAERFPAWRQSLFIGALAGKALIRLALDGDRIVGEQWLLQDRGERIRDVRVGPDGYVYVLTDDSKGKLLRVGPKAR